MTPIRRHLTGRNSPQNVHKYFTYFVFTAMPRSVVVVQCSVLGAWLVLSMWTSIYLVRTENLHIPDANGALARRVPRTPRCVVLGLNGNRRPEAVSQCLCLKQLHHYHKMVLYLEILEKAWAASCISYPLNFVWPFVCGLVSIGAWPNFEYSSEYMYISLARTRSVLLIRSVARVKALN